MRKNVASQIIGAQLVSATDGSAFTGSVTARVTGDGGTQATGSVGSGVCTHEGNGFHTYTPAQAETNYDHVAFTFTGTGAVPVTIQIYTSFPQTGDSFARVGAPAGASVSADIAAVKVDTAAILVDTGTTLDARIPAALVSGRMDASVGAMAANVLTATAINADAITAAKIADGAIDAATLASDTITAAKIASDAFTAAKFHSDVTTELQSGLATAASITTLSGKVDTIDDFLDTEMAAVLADTNELQTDWADGGRLDLILDARASQSSVDTIDNFVDTEVAAIKAVTDLLPDAGALTSLATAAALDAVDNFVDTEITAIKTVTDALGSTAATRLQTAVLTELIGTIDDTVTPTSTEFEAGDITEATADHFNGRIIIFTSGVLQYQASDITDYALASGRGHFTVTGLTEAPSDGDTFIIV